MLLTDEPGPWRFLRKALLFLSLIKLISLVICSRDDVRNFLSRPLTETTGMHAWQKGACSLVTSVGH